jgi:hypothetical protein
MRIGSPARRFSKIEKSARNQAAYASAQKQRIVARRSAARGQRQRTFGFLCKRPNLRPYEVRMLVRRESAYLPMGQRVPGYIGMGQSQRASSLEIES